MKTVVVVNGKPRSGKDTAIEIMRAILRGKGVRTTTFSSIQPVQRLLRDTVDLSAKTEADRKLLSVIGDALEEHSGFRTNGSMLRINSFFDEDRAVFFLQMREPHLIAKMKVDCEAEGIRFIRVCLQSERAEDVTSNPSDAGVERGQYDAWIGNNGTLDDLGDHCGSFLRYFNLLSQSNQHTVD